MTDAERIAAWFASLLAQHDDRAAAIAEAHTHLRNSGLLSKVTLREYRCKRGCMLATVFRIDGSTLVATRDYKYSQGLNKAESVPEARRKNTLDGDRHWPGHVFDVEELRRFGGQAGMSVNCRHYRGTLTAETVLRDVEHAVPGRGKLKPILLGVSSAKL